MRLPSNVENVMLRTIFTLTILVASLCVSLASSLAEETLSGRARFELFGMLNEYMSRFPDGETIEGFYSSERAKAAHFDQVLRQFCKEEKLAPHYERRTLPEGQIVYLSKPIAEAIDIYYATGSINEAVFTNASDEDLLRYVNGAYFRFGDKKRAVLYMPNGGRKMRTVGMVLSRLGCTRVRMYSSRMNMVPTAYVLLFSPTATVKARLGILAETSLGDLDDNLGKYLSFDEEITAKQKLKKP
jgi:hypothetical protein